VTYTVLINFLVQQHCALKVRYGGFPEGFWRSLLFESPLIQAVADATGQPELTQCTLRVLSEVIDFASCIEADVRRHCPQCVLDNPFQDAWEPLIWSIGPVQACPAHHMLLVNSDCGASGNERDARQRRSQHPGVCRHCGSVSFVCSEHLEAKASRSQIWIAEQIGALIAAASGGETFDRLTMISALREAVMIHWGSIAEAERCCGFGVNCLGDKLRARDRRIGLQQILVVASAAGYDVLSMLRGIVAVRVGGPFGVCANEQWLRRKYVSGLTEVAVKEAANNIPNLTLTELCLKVGLSRQALCKRFPQIGADAAAGFSRRQCSSAWCRLLSFARKLREARLHLEATGRAFNRPSIYKYTGLSIRPGSSADRLFQRVKERIESKVDRGSSEGFFDSTPVDCH